MFERFTERARQVVVLAQSEARQLKHNYIGTEHLLMGLLREEEGVASRVLGAVNVDLYQLRSWIVEEVGQGDEEVMGQIPFTPRAKQALSDALREALSLGHNYIGTEHVLLGLMRDDIGNHAKFFKKFGVTQDTIRDEVIRMLSLPRTKVDPVSRIRDSLEALRGDLQRMGRHLDGLEAILEEELSRKDK